MAEPLLRVENLVQRFGGLLATDDVSLDVASGELHAVIGPNGAGKTTLISQLTGELPPDAGTIRFAGQRHHPAAGASPQRGSGWRARSRSPRCCPSSPRSTMSRWRCRRMTATRSVSGAMRARRSGLRDAGARGAGRVGLGASRRHRWSSELSHGEQRELELAMALADQAATAAARRADGRHGRDRIGAHGRAAAELQAEVTILLVEHDMDAVFALADRITVLVYGRVIATGAPAAIRANAEVRRAYLGDSMR